MGGVGVWSFAGRCVVVRWSACGRSLVDVCRYAVGRSTFGRSTFGRSLVGLSGRLYEVSAADPASRPLSAFGVDGGRAKAGRTGAGRHWQRRRGWRLAATAAAVATATTGTGTATHGGPGGSSTGSRRTLPTSAGRRGGVTVCHSTTTVGRDAIESVGPWNPWDPGYSLSAWPREPAHWTSVATGSPRLLTRRLRRRRCRGPAPRTPRGRSGA